MCIRDSSGIIRSALWDFFVLFFCFGNSNQLPSHFTVIPSGWERNYMQWDHGFTLSKTLGQTSLGRVVCKIAKGSEMQKCTPALYELFMSSQVPTNPVSGRKIGQLFVMFCPA